VENLVIFQIIFLSQRTH